jgi:hypothetical protein
MNRIERDDAGYAVRPQAEPSARDNEHAEGEQHREIGDLNARARQGASTHPRCRAHAYP